MKEYRYITLVEKPMIKDLAAEWFHSKWGIPKEAYMECMSAYLNPRRVHSPMLASHLA
jgi:hypothetical protein